MISYLIIFTQLHSINATSDGNGRALDVTKTYYFESIYKLVGTKKSTGS
jgi:hypothetical protein